MIPQTGDRPIPYSLLITAAIAMAGCLILFKQRRDHEKEETATNVEPMD